MKNNVTVVIATFNSEKTLEKCLESIVNQTVIPSIIIADGGSIDSTLQIANGYSDYIQTLFSEKDDGVYDAWNKALCYVKTEWVIFLGSDDYIYGADCISKVSGFLEICEDSIGIVYPNIFHYRDGGEDESNLNSEQELDDLFYTEMPFTHCGSIHRMSTFTDIGKFDDSLRIAGDYDFFLRMIKKYKAIYFNDYKVCIGLEGLSMSSENRIKLLNEKIGIYRKNNKLGFNFYSIYTYLKYFYYCVKCK